MTSRRWLDSLKKPQKSPRMTFLKKNNSHAFPTAIAIISVFLGMACGWLSEFERELPREPATPIEPALAGHASSNAPRLSTVTVSRSFSTPDDIPSAHLPSTLPCSGELAALSTQARADLMSDPANAKGSSWEIARSAAIAIACEEPSLANERFAMDISSTVRSIHARSVEARAGARTIHPACAEYMLGQSLSPEKCDDLLSGGDDIKSYQILQESSLRSEGFDAKLDEPPQLEALAAKTLSKRTDVHAQAWRRALRIPG